MLLVSLRQNLNKDNMVKTQYLSYQDIKTFKALSPKVGHFEITLAVMYNVGKIMDVFRESYAAFKDVVNKLSSIR